MHQQAKPLFVSSQLYREEDRYFSQWFLCKHLSDRFVQALLQASVQRWQGKVHVLRNLTGKVGMGRQGPYQCRALSGPSLCRGQESPVDGLAAAGSDPA